MRLTWYGTAGFCVEVGNRAFLIDPYLSRGDRARPSLGIGPADVTAGSEVYLSHGHFDHAADVVQIAHRTGATVYCSREVGERLRLRGVDEGQVAVARDGDVFDHGPYRAECFYSAHSRVDLRLFLMTLRRALPEVSSLLPGLLAHARWPKGQVLSWRFTLLAEGGRVVHHFGSAGCTADELARLQKLGKPDVLLFPLQGHTHVFETAIAVVERLRPRVVIPHHHDDFFPPVSQVIDLAPFVTAVGRLRPPVQVVELPMGEPVDL